MMRKLVVTLTIETDDDDTVERLIDTPYEWEVAIVEQLRGLRHVYVNAKVNRDEWVTDDE